MRTTKEQNRNTNKLSIIRGVAFVFAMIIPVILKNIQKENIMLMKHCYLKKKLLNMN